MYIVNINPIKYDHPQYFSQVPRMVSMIIHSTLCIIFIYIEIMATCQCQYCSYNHSELYII